MLTSRRQSQKNRATSFSGRDDDDDDDDDDSAVVGSLSIKISRGDVFDDKNLPQWPKIVDGRTQVLHGRMTVAQPVGAILHNRGWSRNS